MSILLLLGRHAPQDHYLGGRYVAKGRRRQPKTVPFALSPKTIHLFEMLRPSQLAEPVPPERIFDSFQTRYQLTALAFARRVAEAGGESFNAESRHEPAVDRTYRALYAAAQEADLAFFELPTRERYCELRRAELEFTALREELMRCNLRHFHLRGADVVARLGRMHSGVRLVARDGLPVAAHIGAGSFFAEQVLVRRALFSRPISAADEARAYVDRLLRMAPLWQGAGELPAPRALLRLTAKGSCALAERTEALVSEHGGLPTAEAVLALLSEAEGERQHRPVDPRPRA